MRVGSKSIGKITFLLPHVLTLHYKSNLTIFHLIAVTARVVSLELVNVSALCYHDRDSQAGGRPCLDSAE